MDVREQILNDYIFMLTQTLKHVLRAWETNDDELVADTMQIIRNILSAYAADDSLKPEWKINIEPQET